MKIPKSITLLCFIVLPLILAAQTSEEIVAKYRQSLENLRTISYEVRQLDTFVTGHVWDLSGQVVLQRKAQDKLLGFHFMASKEEIKRGALYDGQQMFEIEFEPKTYELETNPGPHMMGSPAAQLVVPEMMIYQDTIRPELSVKKDHYILTYHYPDIEEYDISQRKKTIRLDKTTLLPVQVSSSQASLNKKQVMTRFMTNIQINKPEQQQQLDKGFLEDFSPMVEEYDGDLHADLLSSPVKDIQMENFAGHEFSLKDQKGKVMLLDFWDVWCGPCLQSMPEVQALHDQFQSQGLEVIGVLMDKNSLESAQILLKKKGFSFPQVIGNEDTKAYFRVTAIPQYVLIDQEGLIRHVYQGYDPMIKENIQELLK